MITGARFDEAARGICWAAALSISIALSACGPEGLTVDHGLAGQPFGVWSGVVEPDYKHPWVVRFTGSLSCGGVLIDPSWVLTAAHCVYGVEGRQVRWTRTDPYSGVTYTHYRLASKAYAHVDYQDPGQFSNDIGLIKLSTPFAIDKYIQTVGLPATQKTAGTIATLASLSHDVTLETGEVAIYRAPLPASTLSGQLFEINRADAVNNAALDSGDSGSGLVTVEGGRALVRGIASYVSTNLAVAGFSDVYQHRSWILSTMGTNEATLAGNTRVRWSARTSRGYMVLGCNNPAGTMWGPLNVVGVRLGASCTGSQGISCALEPDQPYVIKSFKMTTIDANGNTTTQSLPHSSRVANFYSYTTPSGVIRELTCEVGWSFPTGTIPPGPVVAQ